MAEKDDKLDKLERLQSFDTLPPPASGDAYTAETVQRVVPPELLAEAKRELLKRAPRPAPKKPAPLASPLAPAPLPVIERIFEEDSTDDAETLMRPSTRNPLADGVGPNDPLTVGQAASGTQASADEATSALGEGASMRVRAPTDGLFGSALIFLGSMLLVLLAGLLLMKLVGSP